MGLLHLILHLRRLLHLAMVPLHLIPALRHQHQLTILMTLDMIDMTILLLLILTTVIGATIVLSEQ
jgi:hypothetical protein